MFVFYLKMFSFLPYPVNTLLNVKLSETENGKHVSVLDLPGNILIIPQATLGGRVKGRSMQYHSNSGKEEGLELYSQFVTLCKKELAANSKCAEAGDGDGTWHLRQQAGIKARHQWTIHTPN